MENDITILLETIIESIEHLPDGHFNTVRDMLEEILLLINQE